MSRELWKWMRMESRSGIGFAWRGRAPGLGAADTQTRGVFLSELGQEFVIFNSDRTGIALARNDC